MLDTIDYQRIATASVGALLLAAASIGGVTSPARAAEATTPRTLAAWRADVSRRIDATMEMPRSGLGSRDHAVASVAVRFDRAGAFDGVSMARPSGIAAIDAEALRVARTVHYPALPQAGEGQPRTVAMLLYFGTSEQAERAALRHAADAGTAERSARRMTPPAG